jgi:hypothetical protein
VAGVSRREQHPEHVRATAQRALQGGTLEQARATPPPLLPVPSSGIDRTPAPAPPAPAATAAAAPRAGVGIPATCCTTAAATALLLHGASACYPRSHRLLLLSRAGCPYDLKDEQEVQAVGGRQVALGGSGVRGPRPGAARTHYLSKRAGVDSGRPSWSAPQYNALRRARELCGAVPPATGPGGEGARASILT